jgi:hypothetical protein
VLDLRLTLLSLIAAVIMAMFSSVMLCSAAASSRSGFVLAMGAGPVDTSEDRRKTFGWSRMVEEASKGVASESGCGWREGQRQTARDRAACIYTERGAAAGDT